MLNCEAGRVRAFAHGMTVATNALLTERGATRGDDRFSEAAMEDRKKEGYF